MDLTKILNILHEVEAHGFSVENVAFGMGGGLLQKHNRDTMAFATKLCQVVLDDGTVIDKMKFPNTDTGKFSMPGRFKVITVNGHMVTVPEEFRTKGAHGQPTNHLRVVYDNGPIDVEYETFNEMKERLVKDWKAAEGSYNAIHPSLEQKMVRVREEILNATGRA